MRVGKYSRGGTYATQKKSKAEIGYMMEVHKDVYSPGAWHSMYDRVIARWKEEAVIRKEVAAMKAIQAARREEARRTSASDNIIMSPESRKHIEAEIRADERAAQEARERSM